MARGGRFGSGKRPPTPHKAGQVLKNCKCEPCEIQRKFNNARLREQRKRDPTYVKRMNLRQYGLSIHQYNEMVARAHNRCETCGGKELYSNQHGPMPLSIDHNHKTGEVRGLLCSRCNRALGLLDDSVERVLKLLSYRSRYK